MSRSSETNSATPRRQFIGELAAGAAAFAAVACTSAAAATSAAGQVPAPATPPAVDSNDPVPPQSAMQWDTSWLAKITAKHRAVFDAPEINDGRALDLAFGYLGWVKDVFGTGDTDSSVVVVLRHSAVPMLYNDAMWSKYDLGELTKTKTKSSAKRNTFYQKLDKDGRPVGDEPSATIKSLASRGVIFVGCDLATRNVAYELAKKTRREERAIYDELRENLVPEATLLPTGIFATLLAQEAGCGFMSAT